MSLLDQLTCFVGISQFVLKTEVLNKLPNYISRCRIIPDGVNTDAFQPSCESDRKALRAKIGYSDSDCILLYVGQIRQDKGVLSILDSFKVLCSRYANLRLVLIGSASGGGDDPNSEQSIFYKQFKKKLEDLPASKVQHVGFVLKKELPQWYQLADISLVPSIVLETCNNVVLESMSSGLPTITSQRGGIPEYAGDAVLYTQDPENYETLIQPLGQFIESIDKRREYGEKARKRILENYSWQKTAALTESIYDSLML